MERPRNRLRRLTGLPARPGPRDQFSVKFVMFMF
jgi:hypothetical protein